MPSSPPASSPSSPSSPAAATSAADAAAAAGGGGGGSGSGSGSGGGSQLRAHLTGRPETSSFRRLVVTEADQYRLQRLLSAVGSPFRKMPDKSMQALARSFELVEFQPGDIIMQKGVMGRHLYVVDDGNVELFNVKYGQKPVLVTTIHAQPSRSDLVTGKFNSRMFGQTSLRLAVPQPLGARVPVEAGPCRVWRMSADAYDITLQVRSARGLVEVEVVWRWWWWWWCTAWIVFCKSVS